MKTCLVVDDGSFDRAVLCRHALALGFKVWEADSGKAALEICRGGLPDCMLLDWEMPGMNGIALLQEIRAMPGGNEVRVLICTSHDHPSFVGHAFVQGVNCYLVKPVTAFDLESKLREIGLLI